MRSSCGGNPTDGEGFRFEFPKRKLNHTVAAVMQVIADQMETRILLRRTCDRVANLNRYLIRYLRSNHNVSVLIDSVHKLRYASKYCAKSGKHEPRAQVAVRQQILVPNRENTKHAHKLRYASKYCAKLGKHETLSTEMIEHMQKRSTDLLPPNMKQVLTHLLLADCSHRAFIGKQELVYKVTQLPDVIVI